MSLTFKNPEANTIALGGVPTGSIKARDVAKVHGIMKYSGLAPSCKAWNRQSLLNRR